MYAPGISRQKSIRTYVMFRPWTHTSDDSYIYQLSLVVATATVSYYYILPGMRPNDQQCISKSILEMPRASRSIPQIAVPSTRSYLVVPRHGDTPYCT